ncbi:MAG: hypothetical protein ACT4PW_09815 [Acidimicrobiia bacterium]
MTTTSIARRGFATVMMAGALFLVGAGTASAQTPSPSPSPRPGGGAVVTTTTARPAGTAATPGRASTSGGSLSRTGADLLVPLGAGGGTIGLALAARAALRGRS